MAIVYHVGGNIHSIESGWSVIGDPGGFDTVTTRVLFMGGFTAFNAAYKTGTVITAFPTLQDGSSMAFDSNGGKMICFGVSDTQELPGKGGAKVCKGTITWKGFLNNSGRETKSNETLSIREINYTALAGIPGSPNTALSYKCRVLEMQAGLSVRQIFVGTRPSAPDIPTAAGSGAVGLPNGVSYVGTIQQVPVINAAVTYCYPWGWIPYSWEADEVLPDIWFVKAEYRYEAKTQHGPA